MTTHGYFLKYKYKFIIMAAKCTLEHLQYSSAELLHALSTL